MSRLQALTGLLLATLLLAARADAQENQTSASPNVLVLHVDQWRAQAFGYAGDPNAYTPNLDRLAEESANLHLAVSGMPVCTPHRASLLTGQRPLTNGVFMNDVQLDPSAVTIAEVFAEEGYQTGYIGKWHVDGHGRLSFIPPGGRRQGFEYWKGNECTHDYNHSVYYAGEDSTRRIWDEYDTIAQTEDAQAYLRDRANDGEPFFLMVGYGTPHAPYLTAPEKYQAMFDPAEIELRPNVPDSMAEQVRRDLAGYYAHAAALDEMIGEVRQTLEETGLAENTIILFTSDHGDLLGSHGQYKKQQPYEESIRVPMLVYDPAEEGTRAGTYDALMNSEDIMPTLLGLADVRVPESVEGTDLSGYLRGATSEADSAAVILCIQPFGQWRRSVGGREYRGLRTTRYTYTRSLDGPWQLFDNEADPYQLSNKIDDPAYADVRQSLDALLQEKLDAQGDEFLPGPEYVERYDYPPLDSTGTVPYYP
ncbi:MAG: sulfatase family protein [Rhodothermales bacterium]